MSKDISKMVNLVERVFEKEVKHQPVSVESVNCENDTIGVFLSDYPNIHKKTTDQLEAYGLKISGITQDQTEDQTVNVYLRGL